MSAAPFCQRAKIHWESKTTQHQQAHIKTQPYPKRPSHLHPSDNSHLVLRLETVLKGHLPVLVCSTLGLL